MTTQYKKNNTQNDTRGYALLFTIVIISIISTIAMGLSGTAYKQLVLASVSKDSQSAFYQSDTAVECALYANFKLGGPTESTELSGGTWKCGKDNSPLWKDITLYLDTNTVFEGYMYGNTDPDAPGSNPTKNSCFEFDVNTSNETLTTIRARGYNSCDKRDPKTVEREIEVNY
ncbi:MAG: hypothetical protein KBB75_02290 [Candidatus Pacebacteria bacterium]|jgi:hypothetical protein|nr:hypothetical protein [Candidatus Paceibacterota bacterium]